MCREPPGRPCAPRDRNPAVPIPLVIPGATSSKITTKQFWMGKSSPIIPKVAFIWTVSLNQFSVGKHLILKYSLILQQSCKLRLTCAKTAKPGPGSAQPRPRPTPTPWCLAAHGPSGGPEAPHVGYCQCSAPLLGPSGSGLQLFQQGFLGKRPPRRERTFSLVFGKLFLPHNTVSQPLSETAEGVSPQTPRVQSSSPTLPVQEAAEPRQPGQLPCRSWGWEMGRVWAQQGAGARCVTRAPGGPSVKVLPSVGRPRRLHSLFQVYRPEAELKKM